MEETRGKVMRMRAKKSPGKEVRISANPVLCY